MSDSESNIVTVLSRQQKKLCISLMIVGVILFVLAALLTRDLEMLFGFSRGQIVGWVLLMLGFVLIVISATLRAVFLGKGKRFAVWVLVLIVVGAAVETILIWLGVSGFIGEGIRFVVTTALVVWGILWIR